MPVTIIYYFRLKAKHTKALFQSESLIHHNLGLVTELVEVSPKHTDTKKNQAESLTQINRPIQKKKSPILLNMPTLKKSLNNLITFAAKLKA
jgi:hypothetical protein